MEEIMDSKKQWAIILSGGNGERMYPLIEGQLGNALRQVNRKVYVVTASAVWKNF